ncbi:unnamed protein product, partial [Rotaria sp. Silwood1]
KDVFGVDVFLSIARKVEDTLSLTSSNNDMHPDHITINVVTHPKPLTQPFIQQNIFQQLPPQQFRPNHSHTTRIGNKQIRYYDPSRYSPHSQQPYRCYKCGTPGHYAWDCTRTHFG